MKIIHIVCVIFTTLLSLFSMDSNSQVGDKGQAKHYSITDEDQALIDALVGLPTNHM